MSEPALATRSQPPAAPERGADSPEAPRGLAEFSRYRPRAGHPDWPRLQAEADAIVERVRPGLEVPPRGLRELRRRASSYRTALHNYRTNRRLARAGREDLRPLYFIWTLLRACNFHCEYCDDHQGHKYPDLPDEGTLSTAQALRLLEIMRTGTSSVYFSGGEPTLRADLPELTRAAYELGYHPIIVNTNGSAVDRLLAQERWRDWLARTDVVVVSLDGLELRRLAELWKYPRPEDVVRNLLVLRLLAREMRFKLMVNTVIMPGRVQAARDVLDFANDLGIWFCPVPVNVGPRIRGGLVEDSEYRSFVDLILRRKREGQRITGSYRMNHRMLHAEPLRCRNTLKPHVDFDGHLFWPCKASVNVEPERIPVLDFANVDALYAYATKRVDPTGFHGPAANQCGADCNWAQNYTTDEYARGLEHPFALFSQVVEFLRGR